MQSIKVFLRTLKELKQSLVCILWLALHVHRILLFTDATDSTIAQRPKKRTRVLNDRELLVALHQKQDRHHDWLKCQMQSLLVDVNRIRNLATKNAFVAHEVGVHGKG